MPSLQVRDLPESLYRKLSEEARRDRRSLSQQATIVLARALGVSAEAKERRRNVLKSLNRKPILKGLRGAPPPEALIREDRDR